MEITKRIEKVLRSVFEDENIVLSKATSANDIAAWDSLMHMTVIDAIEQEFAVTFSFNEVSKFNTIGDIIDCIERKQ